MEIQIERFSIEGLLVPGSSTKHFNFRIETKIQRKIYSPEIPLIGAEKY